MTNTLFRVFASAGVKRRQRTALQTEKQSSEMQRGHEQREGRKQQGFDPLQLRVYPQHLSVGNPGFAVPAAEVSA